MVDVTFLGTGGAFCAGRRSNLALLIEALELHEDLALSAKAAHREKTLKKSKLVAHQDAW